MKKKHSTKLLFLVTILFLAGCGSDETKNTHEGGSPNVNQGGTQAQSADKGGTEAQPAEQDGDSAESGMQVFASPLAINIFRTRDNFFEETSPFLPRARTDRENKPLGVKVLPPKYEVAGFYLTGMNATNIDAYQKEVAQWKPDHLGITVKTSEELQTICASGILDGLRWLHLYVYSEKPIDLSPLTRLTTLERLTFEKSYTRPPESSSSNLRRSSIRTSPPPNPAANISWGLEALAGLPKLHTLRLYGFNALTDLAVLNLSKLPHLETLELLSCKSITDVAPLKSLPKMQNLSVDYESSSKAVFLKSLDELTQLKTLRIKGCSASIIPLLEKLSSLEHLDLTFSRGQQLNSFPKLTKLRTLKLSSVRFDQPNTPSRDDPRGFERHSLPRKPGNLTSLAHLTALEYLSLRSAEYLGSLAGLENLSKLKSFHLSRSEDVTNIGAIGGLKTLENLELASLEKVEDFSVLKNLSQLRLLEMNVNDKLKNVTFLAGMPELRKLKLSYNKGLNDISGISKLKNLRLFEGSFSDEVTDLSPLAGMTNVRFLGLSVPEKTTSCNFLKNLTQLEGLILRGGENLKSVGDIGALKKLKTLHLPVPATVSDVSSLAGLKNLRTLSLSASSGGKEIDLAPLADLPLVEVLSVRCDERITSLPSLAQMQDLKVLDVGRNSQLKQLPALSSPSRLLQLDTEKSTALQDFSSLKNCKELMQWDVPSTLTNQNLSDFASWGLLKQLMSLNLGECKNVTDATPLYNCQNLKKLTIRADAFPQQQIEKLDTSLPECAIYLRKSNNGYSSTTLLKRTVTADGSATPQFTPPTTPPMVSEFVPTSFGVASEPTAIGRSLLLTGHTGGIYSANFSGDEKQIFTVGKDATTIQWDLTTRQGTRTPFTFAGKVLASCFTPDKKLLAAITPENAIAIQDALANKTLHTLTGHQGTIFDATFSPDGTKLLTTSEDKTAILWDLNTGEKLHTLTGHTREISAGAFSADGRFCLTGSWDKTAKAWDVASGKLLRTFAGHSDLVTAVAFASDSQVVLTGSADKTAIAWATSTGKPIRTLAHHDNPVTDVQISKDKTRILTVTSKRARLWETATGNVLCGVPMSGEVALFDASGNNVLMNATKGKVNIRSLRGDFPVYRYAANATLPIAGTSPVWGAKYSPNGRILAVERAGRVEFRDAATGKIFQQYNVTGNITSGTKSPFLCFSSDGTRAAVTDNADKKTTVKIFDLRNGKVLSTLEGATGKDIEFSPDGKLVVGATAGSNKAALWDAQTGKSVRTWERSVYSGLTLFSPDGKGIARSKCVTSAVGLYDTQSGELIHNYPPSGALKILAFSNDGKCFYCGSSSYLFVYDAKTGTQLRKIHAIENEGGTITYLRLSKSGKRMLSAKTGTCASLWNTETGQKIANLDSYTSSVNYDFSDDGRRLIVSTGKARNIVKIWDCNSGKSLDQFWIPEPVQSVCFTPDGKNALICTEKETTFWDVSATPPAVTPAVVTPPAATPPAATPPAVTVPNKRERLVWDFEGSSDPIKSIAFSPNGTLLAVGDQKNCLTVWDVRTGKKVATFDTSAVDAARPVASVEFINNGTKIRAICGGPTSRGYSRYAKILIYDLKNPTAAPQDCSITLPDESKSAFVPAISPNGSQFVTFQSRGKPVVRDSKTQKILFELPHLSSTTSSVCDVKFLPDGKRLFACESIHGTRRKMTLWDTTTGKEIDIATLDAAQQNALKYYGGSASATTPDMQLAVGGGFLWNVADNTKLATLIKPRIPGQRYEGAPVRVALANNKKIAAIGFYSGRVQIWNIDGIKPSPKLKPQVWRSFTSGIFSPDGKKILVGNASKKNELCNPEDGTTIAEIPGILDRIGDSFSSDSTRIQTGIGFSRPETWNLWDAADGKEVAKLATQTSVTDPATGKTQPFTATTGAQEPELPAGAVVRLHKVSVNCAVFSSDGKLVLTGSQDTNSQREKMNGRWQTKPGTSSSAYLTRFWDAQTGKLISKIPAHSGTIFGGTFSPDGRIAATAGKDKTIRLYDVQKGTLLNTLESQAASWYSTSSNVGYRRNILEFTPDGKLLVSAGPVPRVWDVQSGKMLQEFKNMSARMILIAPDGKHFFAIDSNAEHGMWNIYTGQEVYYTKKTKSSVGYPAQYLSCRFSGDQKRIVLSTAAGFTKSEQLLDLATGKRVAPDCYWYSSDGKLGVSDPGDGTYRIWDTATNKELFVLTDPPVNKRRSRDKPKVLFWPDNSRVILSVEDPEDRMKRLAKVWYLSDTTPASAEPPKIGIRKWTSPTGTTIEATYVKQQGGWVQLKRPDGRIFAVEINKLSQEDQVYLRRVQ